MTEEDSARPQLEPGAYQSIELEQYEIHKRYLALLKELQVLPASGTGAAIWPRNPGRLSQVIDSYARALFDAEAKRYPQDGQRNLWLRCLAGRIEAMMSRRIWDQDVVSAAKLTYHASREDIDGLIRKALEVYVDEQIGPPPLPVPLSTDPNTAPALAFMAGTATEFSTAVESVSNGHGSNGGSGKAVQSRNHAAENTRTENTQVARQIRSLRREARLTVDELAGKVGIASRSVQRHEAGEVADIRLRHVRRYEKVFSGLLKRSVRIDNFAPTPQ